MKSIKTKFFFLLIAIMLAVFLLNNSILYMQTQETLLGQISQMQNMIASNNQMGIEHFCNAMDQSFRFLIGDRLVGKTLSMNFEDSLSIINAQADITNQFSQCAVSFINVTGGSYLNFLFLNDKIPLAKTFRSGNLDTQTIGATNVYCNTEVKETDWYQKTMALNRSLNIFIDESSNMLCLARKMENVYYAGAAQREGIGVMASCVNRDSLEDLFQFSQITPNTQVLLLNEFQEVLFESRPEEDSPLLSYLRSHEVARETVRQQIILEGKSYIFNQRKLDWGMTLAFLTPYSDTSAELAHFQQIYLLGSMIMILAVAFMSYVVISRITHPMIRLSNVMKNLRDTRLLETDRLKYGSQDEIGTLYRNFSAMIQQINTLLSDVEKRAEQQKNAELKALQAQINPHFIYNAMDSASWLAMSRNQGDIATMLSMIASIMRYVLNSDEFVLLQDELAYVQTYISLQNIRYEDRIQLSMDIPEELLQRQIPKFILQPLVENSILHGIGEYLEVLHIQISAKQERGKLALTVTDDGEGGDSRLLNEYLMGVENGLKVTSGFGIRSVNERLNLRYRGAGRLIYRNREDGKLAAEICIVTNEAYSTFPVETDKQNRGEKNG